MKIGQALIQAKMLSRLIPGTHVINVKKYTKLQLNLASVAIYPWNSFVPFLNRQLRCECCHWGLLHLKCKLSNELTPPCLISSLKKHGAWGDKAFALRYVF